MCLKSVTHFVLHISANSFTYCTHAHPDSHAFIFHLAHPVLHPTFTRKQKQRENWCFLLLYHIAAPTIMNNFIIITIISEVMLYCVLLLFVCSYLCCAEWSICLFVRNLSDQKGKFSFHEFVMNNKVLLYLYCYSTTVFWVVCCPFQAVYI